MINSTKIVIQNIFYKLHSLLGTKMKDLCTLFESTMREYSGTYRSNELEDIDLSFTKALEIAEEENKNNDPMYDDE